MFNVIFIGAFLLFALKISTTNSTSLCKKPSKISFLIITVYMCFICSLRNNTIKDTSVYIDAFTYGDTRMEYGFMKLVECIKYIFSLPSLIFFSISILSVGSKLFFFKRYSSFFWPTVLLYFCGLFISQDFIAIRAAIVSGIFLWVIKFSVEKKIKPFIILSILAPLFHTSGYMVFLVWPIINLPIKLRYFSYLIPGSYILYLLGYSLGYLASYVPNLYVQALFDLYTQEEGKANVFGYSFLFGCILCMFLLYKNRNFNLSRKSAIKIDKSNMNSVLQLNELHIAMLKTLTIGYSLYVLLSDVPVFSARLAQLFFISAPFVYGNLYLYLPHTIKKDYRLLIILVALSDLISHYRNVF